MSENLSFLYENSFDPQAIIEQSKPRGDLVELNLPSANAVPAVEAVPDFNETVATEPEPMPTAHSTAADAVVEEAVIAQICKDGGLQTALSSGLSAEHFSDKRLGMLFEEIQQSEYGDNLEALVNLSDSGKIDEVEFSHLAEICRRETGILSLKSHCHELQKRSQRRKAKELEHRAELYLREGKRAKALELLQQADEVQKSEPESAALPKIKSGMDGLPRNEAEAIQKRPDVVIEGLLYHGARLLIGGIAKVGKSHFTMLLAASIAMGKTFLKWKPSRAMKVLYIDFELSEWELEERAAKATNYCAPENFARLSLRGFGVNSPEKLDKCLRHFDMAAYDAVVFDCLYKFNQVDDENNNAAMQAVCAWLDQVSFKFNFSPIIIHHFGKGNQSGKSVVDRFRGASALSGDVDAMLSLTAHEEEKHVIVESVVRSFEQTPAFTARWDYPHFTLTDLDPHKTKESNGNQHKRSAELLNAVPVGKDNAEVFKDILPKLSKEISEKQFGRDVEKIPSIRMFKITSERDGAKRERKHYYQEQGLLSSHL